MGYIVRMPQLGMSMEEGIVVEWFVEKGGTIEEGDDVVLVESEKTTNEVVAREDGVLRRILASEGTVLKPGDPIAILTEDDDNVSQYIDQIDESILEDREITVGQNSPDETSGDAQSAGEQGRDSDQRTKEAAEGVRATPGARRAAEGETVDLANVTETGPQGVITETDVERHASTTDEQSDAVRATPGARQVAEQKSIDLTSVGGSGPQGVITEADVEEQLESTSGKARDQATRTIAETRELSSIQSTISERLQESYRNAVHVTLNRSFDTEVLQSVVSTAQSKSVTVSMTDLLVKATSDALRTHPEFNAVFKDGEHRLVEEVNIGVAVDIESGLVTPVLPSVTEKDATEINALRSELTDRVQSGEFNGDDIFGGTFTISNLGPFGIDDFDPIINPPEVAILGVGRILDDGSMTLSLSFDHRVVNGADAARFLDTIVANVTDEGTLAGYIGLEGLGPGGVTDDLAERMVQITTENGYSGRYRTSHGDVEFDEPEDIGGSGSAPSPVDHLLGALGSCLSLSVRTMAERDGIDVGPVHCEVVGAPENGPLEEVRVNLDVETDASEEAIDRTLRKAERACYVARSLSDDLQVSVSWSRR